MAVTTETLEDYVARRLEERADELVQDWIDWILRQIDHPLVQALPRQAIRNHIPPVLLSLAKFIRTPAFALREEMLGHLRLHGQIRRDQGYGLRELLAEFDILAQQVQAAIQQDVLDGKEWPLEDVLTVFGRLSTGLRAIVFVAGGAYRETEQMRSRSLAKHLSAFGRTVAHELRSPLQAILLSLSALKDEEVLVDRKAHTAQLETVDAAVRRAMGLLDNIHVLAATESARGESRMQDLAETINSLRQEMMNLAQENDVSLELPEVSESAAIEGVVAQLVLVNLVSNGIKYADPQKRDRWVRVTVELIELEETPFARFSVADNGRGIPDEFQTNIFQRRFRAHPAVAQGTGLGLAISQALVAERGGTIEMQSTGEEGSVFTFTLRAVDTQKPLSTAYLTTHPEDLLRHSLENLMLTEQNGDDRGTSADTR